MGADCTALVLALTTDGHRHIAGSRISRTRPPSPRRKSDEACATNNDPAAVGHTRNSVAAGPYRYDTGTNLAHRLRSNASNPPCRANCSLLALWFHCQIGRAHV